MPFLRLESCPTVLDCNQRPCGLAFATRTTTAGGMDVIRASVAPLSAAARHCESAIQAAREATVAKQTELEQMRRRNAELSALVR